MATVPGVPTIRRNPVASANKLEFYWQAPQNNGNSPINSYTLLCSSISYSTILGPQNFYAVVSSLTNQTNYTFQLAATNAIGTGAYVPFTTVQPGNPSAGPSNVQVSSLNLSTAIITWNFSTNTNESNITWFKVAMIPQPEAHSTIRLAVYPTQRSTIITNISSYTNYNFQVQAISPAGYDAANALTSSIVLGNPQVPTAITNVSTTLIASSTIKISWSGGANATSYIYQLNDVNTPPSNDSGIYNQTATFANLSTNTSYTLEVTANNLLGQATTGFLPTSITSLQLWLDGADPLNTGTAPPTNTIVSSWLDKSGNSNNATGVNSPFYTPTGIKFNGSNQYYTTNYTSQAASETIFVVYNLISNTQAGLVDTNSSGGRAFQSLNGTNGPSLAKSAIAWSLFGAYPIATGISYIATCSYSSSGINIYVTGNTSASNTTNPGFSAGTTWIGAGYANNWYLNGYISEVLIYNTVLSTTNRQMVEGYLAWKWAIQNNLPSNHPYFATQLGGITVTTAKFAPNAIQSLQLWLDGADPLATGIAQTSGTVISTWRDKSGNLRHALGTGSPTMNASNQLTFNGSTQFYTVPYGGLHQIETVFVVINFSSTSGERNIICGQSNQTRQFTLFNNLLNMYSYQTGGLVVSTTVPPSATNIILEYTLNSSANLSIYNNASLLTSVSGFAPSAESGINIGVNGLASGGYLNGTISEVLIYNSVLSTANRQIVEGYLAWKWLIQASLPANHPYYNKSP